MRFTINPITDEFDVVGLGSGVFDETITGNTGGAVGPDGSGNINLLGDNASGITVVGAPAVNTLQIFGLASSTTQIGTTRYATNAEAAAQSSTTVALTPSNITSLFSTSYLPASQGGTGLSSPAAHSLLVTNGSSAFTVLGTASNGQIPIGSVGGDPVLANITSSAGTITVTNGPGTINIDLAGGSVGVDSFSPDSGTDPVVPTALGLVNMKGSGSITTVGSLNTITTQLTGLTNHSVLVGAGTTTITKVAPSATSGIPLVSNGSSADPSFTTAVVAGGGTGSTSFNINGAVYSNTTTTGALQAATLTSGQLLIGGTTTPAAATLTQGTGITITNGNNSITIAATGAGLSWTDQSTSFAAAVNNGYFVTGTATATLPASPSQGDTIRFIVDAANVLTVTANTGQFIRVGSSVSASAGTAASNARGDALTIVYRSSDTTWLTMSSMGVWTVT